MTSQLPHKVFFRSALEILELEVRGSVDQKPKGPVPECQVVSILLSTLLSSLTGDANIHDQ